MTENRKNARNFVVFDAINEYDTFVQIHIVVDAHAAIECPLFWCFSSALHIMFEHFLLLCTVTQQR